MDDIEISDEGTSLCWKQFAELVESENWTSDDHSVLSMLPNLESTNIVLAKTKIEGNFVGAVVWNEYDNVAFLGFYLLTKEERGKGVGTLIWERAMNRISKDLTIILVAVPEMSRKYQSTNTPIVGAHHHSYKIPWRTAEKIFTEECSFEKKIISNGSVTLISNFSEEEWRKLFELDKTVTGRNRENFLRLFYGYDFTEGCAAFDERGNMLAYAGVTSTSVPEAHLFKLAPVYAPNLALAKKVILPLIKWIGLKDKEAVCMFLTLSDTKAEKELAPLFQKYVTPKLSGITLYSRSYKNSIDMNMLYIANNHSGHYDA